MRKRTILNLYCLPLIVYHALPIIIPLTYGIYLSLISLNFVYPERVQFVGISNYIDVFDDPDMLNALGNSLLYILVPVPLQLIGGVGLALLLQHKSKLIRNSRALYLPPMIIPPVIVGLIWRLMLIKRMGAADQILSIFNMTVPDFFGNPTTARVAVITACVWQWTPFVMLMVLAALESMPSEPFDAAKIDGASSTQVFYYITLPLIKPVLFIAAVFRIIGSLDVFPVVYSLTKGGPGITTEPLNLYAFRQGFEYFKISYAATIAMIIFALIFSMNYFFVRKALSAFR